MVAEGCNSPEIGRQLGITVKTVDAYKHRSPERGSAAGLNNCGSRLSAEAFVRNTSA